MRKILLLSLLLWGLICACATAQDTISKQIPILVLKNKQIQSLTDTLVFNTKGTNRSNVVFLSVCKFNGHQLLFSGCINKGLACYLVIEPEFQSLQLVGFLNISGYDCFVFGDHSIKRFFRQTKDSILIPKELEWISEVSKIQYMDDLFNHIDTYNRDVPIFITFDILRYVYKKSKFEENRPDSKNEDIFSDFRSAKWLRYRK